MELKSRKESGLNVEAALEKMDMSLTKGDAHLHWMELLNPMSESLLLITQYWGS